MPSGNRMAINSTTVVSGTGVRVRSAASTASSSNILYTISQNASVTLLQETEAENYYWYKCKNNTDTSKPDGYIRSDLLQNNNTGAGNGGGGANISEYYYGQIKADKTGVNVRDNPSTASSVKSLGQWNGGSKFLITQQVGNWMEVLLGKDVSGHHSVGRLGYISADFVTVLPYVSGFTQRYTDIAKSFANQNGKTAFFYDPTDYGSWCQAWAINMAIAADPISTSVLPQPSDGNTNTWSVCQWLNSHAYYSTSLNNCEIRVGDWVYYLWSADELAGENMSHVGIATSVSGRTISTVEGCLSKNGDTSSNRYILTKSGIVVNDASYRVKAIGRPNW